MRGMSCFFGRPYAEQQQYGEGIPLQCSGGILHYAGVAVPRKLEVMYPRCAPLRPNGSTSWSLFDLWRANRANRCLGGGSGGILTPPTSIRPERRYRVIEMFSDQL